MTPVADFADITITGLASDSRRVEPGFLFAALPGSRTDGRLFVGDAVRAGATVVLAPVGTETSAAASELSNHGVALITDDNPRRRLAQLAARFYPQQPGTIAAVTGTNGKTSVVWFLRQIWQHLGARSASLGTLGITASGINVTGSLTTPDPIMLHQTLAGLADSGVDHLAIEASSHGLDQYRLDGVRVAAAAFTNFSRDHLDYHGSVEAYLAAKLRLFSEILIAGGVAVLNADVGEFRAIEQVVLRRGLRMMSYGRRGDDLRLERVEPTADGQVLTVTVEGRAERVRLSLAGEFQAYNALCACALAVATGVDPKTALAALEGLEAVPGRLEQVARLANGAPVFVDYAHTPDAVATALSALRPLVRGRLWIVFGCGGDRDPGKRAEMGAIAARQADAIVVTDDNPRGEPAAVIRSQILDACPQAMEIGDRRRAIAAAMSELRDGDVLLVAGKGHETGQIIGDRVLPFDDRAVVRTIAEEIAS